MNSPANRYSVAIIGCGTVGRRAAFQLVSSPQVERLVLLDQDPAISSALARDLGPRASVVGRVPGDIDVALVATTSPQVDMVRGLVSLGIGVVTTTDEIADVQEMFLLDHVAQDREVSIIVGAGFAPGLSDVLAAHAASTFEVVREIHTAKFGTAGPACARQHHYALAHDSLDWRDGEWVSRPGGSGRELCWFPGTIGGADCYRAALPEAILLHRRFPGAERLTARMAATRRDRLTSRLPMLRKPHAEARDGAVRVEVRGRQAGEERAVVLACSQRPSVAAGTVAAIAVLAVLTGLCRRPGNTIGTSGLAEFVDPLPFLRELATRGVACSTYEGTTER
jgi:hypothetical protein